MDTVKKELIQKAINHLKRKELSAIFDIMLHDKDGVLSFNDVKIPNKTDILLEAILIRNLVFIEKILDGGFDLLNGGFLYLHHAIRSRETRIVNLLLRKINANVKDISYINKVDHATKNSALHIAIDYKVSTNMLIALSDANADWNVVNSAGITPVFALFFDKEYFKRVLTKELVNSFVDKIDFKNKCNEISVKDIIDGYREFEDVSSNENFQYLLTKVNAL